MNAQQTKGRIPESLLREFPQDETRINWELVDKIREAKEKAKLKK